MSMRRLTSLIHILLLATILICPLAIPASSFAQNNSTRLATAKSRYYTIHSNAGRAEVQFVQRYMDMLFSTYQRRFSEFRRRDNSPMDLYLFAQRSDYQQFLVQQNFGAASTSGGVFFVNNENKGLATYIEERDPEWTLQTLRHEGFHQFAYAYIGPNLPLWVNEGLAEYFAEGIVYKGRIMPGIIPGRRVAAVRNAIIDDTAFEFAQLISMNSQTWQRLMETRADHGAMLYNQSWSMVHFLIHADDGRYASAFSNYLKLLADDMESVKAFEQAFGTNDLAAFRRKWVQYVAELQPDALSATLDDLRFQAIGLRTLAEQEERAPVTAHQLKKRLQQGNFYITQQGHGQQYRLEASDDSLFSYTLPNGQEKPYLLLEPSRNDLPPRLTAPGLRPEPTVNWTRNDKNQLVFRIDFR